jgi:glutathione S-transferase
MKDDDGFILYESRAIARYLIKKYPTHGAQLIPSDPKSEALFEQAASIEAFNFTTFVTPIVVEKVFKPWVVLFLDLTQVIIFSEGVVV